MSVKLSLIIPIYNAESFIYNTLIQLKEWKQNFEYGVEIICVNDGSTDGTGLILENFVNKNNDLKLVSYSINKGKGYAVKKGMIEAQGEFRIFTDADIPYGLAELDRIIYYLDFKEFDVCIGNRKSVDSEYIMKMSFLRKLSSKLFTMLISRYVVTGVNDTQCGLKGFRADIADKIFSKLQVKGFAFDVEVLYLCYKYEFDIKRIPVKFQGNNISTINLLSTSLSMFWDVLSLPVRYHLLKKY
ncbi:glycosyltransferase [Flavivirga algicola]|uniref:Glycosyltransferase n=1 Tax=Flavivirga algicola TaxID=2729136 RepID=A0ABX1RWC1_9FLAO|nr:glycosyltransferase [Flavivirga algicola]NMH87338.1 glycosyltransferase [Flavivirga algicola]